MKKKNKRKKLTLIINIKTERIYIRNKLLNKSQILLDFHKQLLLNKQYKQMLRLQFFHSKNNSERPSFLLQV